MLVSHGLRADLSGVAAEAQWAKDVGYSVLGSAETAHDPFLPLALAAPVSGDLLLQTGIVVAFGRSPMTVAQTAHDLHVLSGGRFVLGLGTQTRAHIRRRFDMPWSGHPVAQMREYVSALHAIWRDWDEGQPLSFNGDHYKHTLMTDVFRPGPSGLPAPAVHLAAVGPAMTRLAGEVCEGLVPHGFSTPAWYHQVTLPALHEGLERTGRDRAGFVVHAPGFKVVTGPDGAKPEQIQQVRRQIAFYGSTPAYGGVLELHGWGELHQTLHRMSVTDDPERWAKMADLIDDEVVNEFCVIGTPREVAAGLLERYGDTVDQVSLPLPDDVALDDFRAAVAMLGGKPAA